MSRVWDKFEWDNENRKNGNVQHLREHGIEPEEAEECFFHDYDSCKDERFDDIHILEAAQIAVDVCGSSSKIRAIGSRAFLLVGI